MSISIEEVSRTQRLKQMVLDAPYTICIERARCVTQAWRENAGAHPSIRAARALENTLRNMSIFILDDERIAGNYCSAIVGTMLPVERGEMNLVLEMDLENLLRRERQPYVIDPADKRELMGDIIPYWRGRTVRDEKARLFRQRGLLVKTGFGPYVYYDLVRSFGWARLKATLSRFVKGRVRQIARSARELPVNNPNLVNNVFDVQGHLIVGHNRIIETGFRGVRDHALEKMNENVTPDERSFLESVVIVSEAVRDFAARFAALAREKAADPGTSAARRAELEDIAAAADRVPWLPPESFREAVQFLWFAQVAALVSTGLAGINAIGRPDQYLYPFYKKDIDSGAISEAEALELIEELLIKLSNNLIMLPSFGKDTGSELGADSMAPTFGGLAPDGADATNELSYLFLDAVKNLRAMSNSYSVRFSEKTPPEFYSKVAEVHAVTSGIAMFNDEAIVPALEGCGCSTEDARDYGIIGCVEPTPQGSTFGCTSGNDVSLVGCLEMTFTGGRVRMVGRRVGPNTGNPLKFENFEQFLDAYRSQLAFSVKLIADCVNAKDDAYASGWHNPYISATLDGCVESARDMTCGGAKYNFSSISGRGLATVADSLSVIKKLVYEEKKLAMSELMSAIRTNFRGCEPLRQMLRNKVAKFGSDNGEADDMARLVAEMFCDEVSRHRSVRENAPFRPGFFSYGMHVMDGSLLGATPDGRLAGEPVSNSLSPSTGTESKGPTAVMCSVSRLEHSKISNGSSLNMKLMPGILKTEEGRMKFESMLKGYFDMGGMHVQFNFVDNATLRAARENPDQYRDLIVRVSGYVAYFVDLGESLQNDLIKRTEFGEI